MVLVFIITFCTIVALGFGAAAAWSDYNKLMIPNLYSVLIAVSFIPAFLAVLFFAPDISFFGSWKNHLFAAVFMFAVTYGLFHFKLIGGGDSKLLTSFALWSGVQGLMPLLFMMAVTGGVLGGSTLALNKWKPIKKPTKDSWIDKSQGGQKDVPYGIAIFVGAIFSFWHAGYIQPQGLMSLALETTGDR